MLSTIKTFYKILSSTIISCNSSVPKIQKKIPPTISSIYSPKKQIKTTKQKNKYSTKFHPIVVSQFSAPVLVQCCNVFALMFLPFLDSSCVFHEGRGLRQPFAMQQSANNEKKNTKFFFFFHLYFLFVFLFQIGNKFFCVCKKRQ